jgi:integrase
MKSIYTTPKVTSYSDLSKPWFVWFRYDGHLYRFKQGINRYKTYRERMQEASALCTALHNKLKTGWNPDDVTPQIDHYTFKQALEFALEQKKGKLNPKTISDYGCTTRFILDAAETLLIDRKPVRDITRRHVTTVLYKAKLMRQWSNKAFNKNLNQLKALMSELVRWELIPNNPAFMIQPLETDESVANIPPTDEDRQLIREHLAKRDPNYLRFAMLIFHTGIRVREAIKLQIGMVNMRERTIIVPGSIAKNKKTRVVPLNPFIHTELQALNIHQYPRDFFLFGSYRAEGIGNRQKEADFIPGPTKLKDCTCNRRWKRLIKQELGINKTQYSLKHCGADAKIIAGMDMDALRHLYGHQSKQMTEVYARKIKQVYMKEIMEKSPDF